MNDLQLSTDLLVKLGGWEVLKEGRGILAAARVLSSNWSPPILKGVVQEGSISYRAGLVIKSSVDVENMCSCRASRQWGTICAHSIAVGLKELQGSIPVDTPRQVASNPSPSTTPLKTPQNTNRRLLRATLGHPGPSAELALILPPNFTTALSKGRVMLVIEAVWSRGRTPLNALPLNQPFLWSAQDGLLLDHLEGLARNEVPATLMLTKEEFVGLLPLLVDHRSITLGRSHSVCVSNQPRRSKLSIKLLSSGELSVQLGALPDSVHVMGFPAIWTFENNQFQPLGLPTELASVLKKSETIPRNQVPFFVSTLGKIRETVEVETDFNDQSFTIEKQPLKIRLALAGGLSQLSGSLFFKYGSLEIPADSREFGFTIPLSHSPMSYLMRDADQENKAKLRFLSAGFVSASTSGQHQISGQEAVIQFFARHYVRLQQEWEVTLEERLEKVTLQNLERIEPRFEIQPSGEQWFDLAVKFSTSSGQQFHPSEIQQLLRSGRNHTRLANGKLAIFDTAAVEDFQEVLLDCMPQQHTGNYKIHTSQAGFLETTLSQQPTWSVVAPGEWRERATQQRGEIELKPPPLGDLEKVLRPYQIQGVAWLLFLRNNHFGGILADEMGLGKTLQTLAFLQSTIGAKDCRPSLIVCPTSLVYNWVEEAKKFTPELKVLALHGTKRQELFSSIPQVNIVVTSYALIRRDAAFYGGMEFDTLVLDEAQHIKNRQTQNAQAVKAVRATHRLVLTGTPLENSVLDLWSIFDFLMPGYLGQAKDFKERYEVPITRGKDEGAQRRLTRRVRPFLLRRLKRDVAKELPSKIEQVAYCELNASQLEIYQQLLTLGRNEVEETVGRQGLTKSRFAILNVLLRLRQVCCDPRLLKLESQKQNKIDSGKVEMFTELLEEVIDGGHRVLVFSQFVQMLHLIRDYLDSENIAYCYLDGSTVNRGEVVQKFQTNAAIPVFLISLKAGGVGLNLTGADTVIHFDPWWNPAVEDQATDRAHRIGQQRVVTSYKLITRGTVEEKILNLQNRKRGLINATLQGEEQLTEALSWEEIQDLLS